MLEVRTKLKLSQTEMAENLNVSRTTIKNIESGKTKLPSLKLLNAICDYTKLEKIAVVTVILFGKEGNNAYDESFLGWRYLSYMYLKNWKVERPFHYYDLPNGDLSPVCGRISKKRDPNNVIIVLQFDQNEYFYDPDKAVLEEREVYRIFLNIVTIILNLGNKFRSVHVIFDFRDPAQMEYYDMFRKFKIKKLITDIRAVLYDPEAGYVIHEELLKKK